MDKIARFIRDRLYSVPGQRVLLVDFYSSFIASLPARERAGYPKRAVVETLRAMGYVIGRSNNNQVSIGNLAWSPALAERPYVQWDRQTIRRAEPHNVG